ncbi:hypothetical protein LZ554_008674 [Drepanopeziza brunnea f. sp. 'monogermtubi']|nr:hypothetical protein LZ554_008674 [Drepanopeziza brunnea f. sp. 'monogermtubi']
MDNLMKATEDRQQMFRAKIGIKSGHKNTTKDTEQKLSGDGKYPGKEAYKPKSMLGIQSNSAILLVNKEQFGIFTQQHYSKIFATDGAAAIT